MASYFQMGHDTENLVGEEGLEDYGGLVVSPVNRGPDDLRRHLRCFREKMVPDVLLDPQLYFPRSERGHLRKHPYFPSDFETADLGSISWRRKHTRLLADYAVELGVTSVASPAFIPKVWSDDFYVTCSRLSSETSDALNGCPVQVLTTVMANTGDLTRENQHAKIASILSRKPNDGYYVVFITDKDPRRELSDEAELFGMLCLIRELKKTGSPVLVSHCSSDMVLFKYAGADHCATGKFFNLRRFTKSRYEEPNKGGGQLPYWFEHSLMAFLRQADILRLQREQYAEFLGVSCSDNLWGSRILDHLASDEATEPWLALSWRQYLNWFVKAERVLSSRKEHVREWLKTAEENWRALEDDDVLFDDPRNDGAWLRAWRQSLIRFRKQRH